MSETPFRFTLEPKPLTKEEILGITDPYEKKFAITAFNAGFEVRDGGMITLNGKKLNKQDKLSTNPDFLINGVFIEITQGENLGSRKARQRSVMERSGLPYVQLTGLQVDEIIQNENPKDSLVEILKLNSLNKG